MCYMDSYSLGGIGIAPEIQRPDFNPPCIRQNGKWYTLRKRQKTLNFI